MPVLLSLCRVSAQSAGLGGLPSVDRYTTGCPAAHVVIGRWPAKALAGLRSAACGRRGRLLRSSPRRCAIAGSERFDPCTTTLVCCSHAGARDRTKLGGIAGRQPDAAVRRWPAEHPDALVPWKATPRLKNTACGMGASSYWREYHIWRPIAAGTYRSAWKNRPGRRRSGQTYSVLPFSITVRRCELRSAFRTSVIGTARQGRCGCLRGRRKGNARRPAPAAAWSDASCDRAADVWAAPRQPARPGTVRAAPASFSTAEPGTHSSSTSDTQPGRGVSSCHFLDPVAA